MMLKMVKMEWRWKERKLKEMMVDDERKMKGKGMMVDEERNMK